ncbi:MAG: SgcJ/EcaC family oxidoreductase [Pirellulales bacterium]
MSNTHGTCWLLSLAILAGNASKTIAQEENQAPFSLDRAAIEKAIQSYVSAFNAGDAKKLAAHWSPEGTYISRRHSEDSQSSQVIGRTALTEEFTALFAESADVRLQVATESIEFISPNVALERGTATVLRSDSVPESTEYRVVYVKRDNQWLIDRVTEETLPNVRSQYDKLKGLEWLIGDWEDQTGEINIKTECQWTRNKNYMTRSFTITANDQVEMSGMQLVGWDPAENVIRSWLFDSDGGFASAVWKQQGQRWTVQTTATLTSGQKGSSMNIFRPIDENSFGWQKINRLVDGEILPNIDEVIVVRSGSQQ